MSGNPAHLLTKLEGDAASINDSDMLAIAQYLGIAINYHEEVFKQLKSELRKQNTFLSSQVQSDDVKHTDFYKNSPYVRETVDRAVEHSDKGAKSPDNKATVEDVEKALLTLCDVVEYPLYVATATGDRRITRFVAELAADIFLRTQVKFREFVSTLEHE